MIKLGGSRVDSNRLFGNKYHILLVQSLLVQSLLTCKSRMQDISCSLYDGHVHYMMYRLYGYDICLLVFTSCSSLKIVNKYKI